MNTKNADHGSSGMDGEYSTEVLAHPGVELDGMPERDEYSLERAVRVGCPYCDRAGRTTERVNLCAGCGCYFEVVRGAE